VTAAADLVRRLNAAFNSTDLKRLLTLVTDDIDWPDGPAMPGAAGRRGDSVSVFKFLLERTDP
jgi:hypothetical protein